MAPDPPPECPERWSLTMTIRKILIASWLPVLLLVLWGVVTAASQSIYFPPLTNIATRFQENWLFDRFIQDVVPSMTIFLGGYVLAVAIGIVLGLVLAFLPLLEKIVDPFLQFMRALPSIALVPVVLVFAGIGIESKIMVVAFGALWPVLLNTIDGITAMEPELKRTAKTFRVPWPIYVTKVMLPAAGPNIMAGARVSLAIALVLTVGSELYAATQGIGHFVLQSQQSFQLVDMWTGIILLGILGYVCTQIFSVIERKVVKWAA